MGVSRESMDKSNERPDKRLARRCSSDPGDDLDPSLVYRLEPLSLLLGILVWDGVDGVVPPAILVDLGMRSDDDLVDHYLPPVGLDDH